MPVTSRPLSAYEDESQDQQPKATTQIGRVLDNTAVRILAFAVGGIWWLSGARYTLEGWMQFINVFLQWFFATLPGDRNWQLPAITSPGVYILLVLVAGIIYSRVEVGQYREAVRGGVSALGVGTFILFIFANGSDWGSSYLGMTAPQPEDAWPVSQWLAATLPAAALWSLFTTYGPEVLLFGVAFRGVSFRWRKRKK